MRLRGARAVATEGASGLGLAVAHRLVELGERVVVLDLRPPVALPPRAAYVEADVGSEAAADRAMAEAVNVLGGLALVVSCAGISRRGRVVGREGPMAQADFARVMTVNLIGTFTACRPAATVMQHNEPEPDGERDVIANTASIAAFDGQVGQAAYAASKRGVVTLTLPLARELASFGVRVVTIAPGAFETPMVASLTEPKTRPEVELDAALIGRIRSTVRAQSSPRHVPAKIIPVPDVP